MERDGCLRPRGARLAATRRGERRRVRRRGDRGRVRRLRRGEGRGERRGGRLVRQERVRERVRGREEEADEGAGARGHRDEVPEDNREPASSRRELHGRDRFEPGRGYSGQIRPGEVPFGGESRREQGEHAHEVVEVRARRDALLRVPPSREHTVHGGVRRGYIRRGELLRQIAVQGSMALLPVRPPVAGSGRHTRQGSRDRVQVSEQQQRVVLHRKEERGAGDRE